MLTYVLFLHFKLGFLICNLNTYFDLIKGYNQYITFNLKMSSKLLIKNFALFAVVYLF